MSKRKKTRPSDLVQWARRATKALDDTSAMIGFVDETRDGEQYWAFAVQVGRCLLEQKPILLLCPEGAVVPERLKAAASAVEYYIDGNPASVEAACKRAFETIGMIVKH